MTNPEHPIIAFTRSIDSLIAEHAELRATFQGIQNRTKRIADQIDPELAMDGLAELKDSIQAFMVQLERHLAAEKRDLFPVLRQYVDLTEAELAEQEHALAETFIHAYVEYLKPWEKAAPSEMITFLNQAYLLIEAQMKTDTTSILTPAEQIMNDLEYLSC